MPNLASGGRRPLVLGHRGAPREVVENTLASFARALALGADGVELDVRRSRDGRAVVIHDNDLRRTMNVAGRISSLHWGSIQRLSGARVPSLDQVTAWAAASGAWLNIELKSAGIEPAVLEEVERTGVGERTILSSFDAEVVRRLGELDPSITRYFLTERWNAAARRALGRAGAHGVCLRVDAATPNNLHAIRDLGLPVIVWTVNAPATMRSLFEKGVAAIITDDPAAGAEARAAFAEARSR